MRNITPEELDALVAQLARKNTRPIIDTTLREIAAEIAEITGGYQPSTSVVKASLDKIARTRGRHRWTWKHNGGKE